MGVAEFVELGDVSNGQHELIELIGLDALVLEVLKNIDVPEHQLLGPINAFLRVLIELLHLQPLRCRIDVFEEFFWGEGVFGLGQLGSALVLLIQPLERLKGVQIQLLSLIYFSF